MTEKEKKKDESGLSSLANFVPSAYYDLIARVCPGIAFWLAIYLSSGLLQEALPLKLFYEASGGMLFILLLLSYVSGIVLTGFCLPWDWLSLNLLTTKWLKKAIFDEHGASGFVFHWKQMSSMMDEVTKLNEDAGKVLIKALAEVALCQNLLSGMFFLLLLNTAERSRPAFPPTDFLVYYIVIFFALFLSMTFRQAMFLGRVVSLHGTYKTPK